MEKKPYSDPRWWDNPKPKGTQCNSCKHFYGFRKCKAFPDGIPRELSTSKFTHKKPYEGDHGIRYEKGVPTIIVPPEYQT